MGHAQGQRAVRARSGRDMPICAGGRSRAARVDDDQVAAVSLCLAQKGHEVRRGGDRIVPPDDHQAAVRHLLVRRAVAYAQRGIDGEFRRGAADRSFQAAGA